MDENYVIERKPYRYNVVRNNKVQRVVCFSTYAKKTYVGVSTCSPEDNFDLDKGMRLARLRCDRKINRVKLKYVQERIDFISEAKKWCEQEYWNLACLQTKYMKDDDATEEELKAVTW